jgi:gliding motility associated protien GldN
MMRNLIVLLSLLGCFTAIYAQHSNNRAPLDGIVERRLVEQRIPLAYPEMDESDVFWEKRTWQIIDTREKMNQPFMYPNAPFFNILVSAIANGDIIPYSTENDKFSTPMDKATIHKLLFQADTFDIFNPLTHQSKPQILKKGIDYQEIDRFQIKEIWYFDAVSSTMKARILGIAPIRKVVKEGGVLVYETPLFWIYYPHCRSVLAKHLVYNPWNDHSVISWEDLFEMRFFSSYIYKESNVNNTRIKDMFSGRDALVEANRIKQELFNFEQDLWSY